jgi:hypothetical protein
MPCALRREPLVMSPSNQASGIQHRASSIQNLPQSFHAIPLAPGSIPIHHPSQPVPRSPYLAMRNPQLVTRNPQRATRTLQPATRSLSFHQRHFFVVPVHKCRGRKTETQINNHDHRDTFQGLTGLIDGGSGNRYKIGITDGHGQ